jgi:hypothetical protein
MMSRVPIADDFATIRYRLEELRRERTQHHADSCLSPSAEPEAATRQPAAAARRTPLVPRRLLRTRFWNLR